MKKVYVISECQNEYQAGRVKKFLDNQKATFLNTDSFCYPYGDLIGGVSPRSYNHIGLEDVLKGKTSAPLKRADEVWIILDGKPYFTTFKEERKAKKLGIKIKYFHINQSGRYAGRVHEVKRRELFN